MLKFDQQNLLKTFTRSVSLQLAGTEEAVLHDSRLSTAQTGLRLVEKICASTICTSAACQECHQPSFGERHVKKSDFGVHVEKAKGNHNMF